MNEDDPSDTVHEAFTSKLFGDTPLGRPILGTTESINGITRDQILTLPGPVTPEHLVVAAAGNLDHDTVWNWSGRPSARPWSGPPSPPRPGWPVTSRASRPGRVPRWSPAASSRPTGARCQARGPHRRAPLRARRAQRGLRRGACPPGCSRRCGRSGAWPTRCTASPASTPTPACGASTSAACPPRPTRCWPSAPRRSTGLVSGGLTTRGSPAAKARCAARSAQPWRTRPRG